MDLLKCFRFNKNVYGKYLKMGIFFLQAKPTREVSFDFHFIIYLRFSLEMYKILVSMLVLMTIISSFLKFHRFDLNDTEQCNYYDLTTIIRFCHLSSKYRIAVSCSVYNKVYMVYCIMYIIVQFFKKFNLLFSNGMSALSTQINLLLLNNTSHNTYFQTIDVRALKIKRQKKRYIFYLHKLYHQTMPMRLVNDKKNILFVFLFFSFSLSVALNLNKPSSN